MAAGEVPLGEDADQMLAPEDRKGADLVPVHAVGRLVQTLVRLGGEQLVVLQVGDLRWCLLSWLPGTVAERRAHALVGPLVCPQRAVRSGGPAIARPS